MPSPFPGMDPYLEGEEWTDFHGRFNIAMSAALSRPLRPKYAVRAERRVYLDDGGGEDGTGGGVPRTPDYLLFRDFGAHPGGSAGGGGTAVAAPLLHAPVVGTLPQPVRRRETYLVIRTVPGRELVTVIETLSPANKRRGSRGRRQYLRKREEILAGSVHLVEIDLLRGGEPMPTQFAGEEPPCRVIVSRAGDRPQCGVFPVPLPATLPTVPVPLLPEDGHVPLNLQAVFERTFDEIGYEFQIDYTREPTPPFGADEAAFARTLPGVLTADGDAPLHSAATQ